MRRLRKQPVCKYNSWNWNAEPGDRMYISQPNRGGAYMVDLIESNGRNKRAAGELTPRLVKKNGRARLAVVQNDGFWYWAE